MSAPRKRRPSRQLPIVAEDRLRSLGPMMAELGAIAAGTFLALFIGAITVLSVTVPLQQLGAAPALVTAVGWKTVVWVVLVVVVEVVWNRATPARRAVLVVLAAVAASVIEAVVALLLNLGNTEVLAFGMILVLIQSAALVVSVAITAFATAAVIQAPATLGGRMWPIAVGALLAVGGGLVLALLWQWFGVYFDTTTPQPGAAEGDRYLLTVLAGLVVLGGAIALAFWRGYRSLRTVGAVLIALLVLIALVFSVPHGRWFPVVSGDGASVVGTLL